MFFVFSARVYICRAEWQKIYFGVNSLMNPFPAALAPKWRGQPGHKRGYVIVRRVEHTQLNGGMLHTASVWPVFFEATAEGAGTVHVLGDLSVRHVEVRYGWAVCAGMPLVGEGRVHHDMGRQHFTFLIDINSLTFSTFLNILLIL